MSEINNIDSITTGPRQSNFELLRIIAMFLVLGLHFNFKYTGIPVFSHSLETDINNIFQIVLEAICLPAVNVFILISGWFSIHATYKGLFSYLFQCVYFLLLTFIFSICIIPSSISIKAIIDFFMLSKYGWFIVSYLILYIISPILNSFLDRTNNYKLVKCLIVIYLSCLYFGWLGDNSNYNNGYSVVSFINLYVLGRFMALYYHKSNKWLYLLMGSTILNAIILYLDIYYLQSTGISRLLSYLNPLIILQAMSLIMIFSSIKLRYSKTVNFIAKSAFAVYLIHDCARYQISFLELLIDKISVYHGMHYLIIVLMLIAAIYIIAVLFDQGRIFLWNKLSTHLNKKIEGMALY